MTGRRGGAQQLSRVDYLQPATQGPFCASFSLERFANGPDGDQSASAAACLTLAH